MLDEKKLYQITNRSGSTVVYSLPEDGIQRTFVAGETKKIYGEELIKLSYRPGGLVLLSWYLQVQDAEVLDSLNLEVEPEYNMSEADVKNLLIAGSLDEFLDCLDFAPEGVLELVKKIAIELPLNDVQKRQSIKDKLGFDVSAAIQHKKEAEEEEDAPILKQPERRVKKETKAPGRRVDTPKYIIPEAPAEVKE